MAALCLLFCAGCGVLLSSYVGLLALKYFFLCSVSLVVVSTVCFSMVLVCVSSYLVSFFFFTQKTSSEMRISAWSSAVCSSDLLKPRRFGRRRVELGAPRRFGDGVVQRAEAVDQAELPGGAAVPDPSLGDFADALHRHVAGLGDEADETAIDALNAELRSEEHTSESSH